MTLEHHVATLGAPTLAGLKTGNIFNTAGIDTEDLTADADTMAPILAEKGLQLKFFPRPAWRYDLCYLYREAALKRDLADPVAEITLKKLGYDTEHLDRTLSQLGDRLKGKEFPHEIGFFLSYCPQDVVAFMKYGSASALYIGHWCVYSQVAEKRLLFDRFDRCKKCYARRYRHKPDLRLLFQEPAGKEKLLWQK